jgi:hypothetical protein
VADDDDDRYVVVGGRRWRRSDPSIPEPLRQELVDELMDARRAVKSAKGADDETATTTARARVDAAKRALGERGRPWWEEADGADRAARLDAAVVALTRHRHPKTICPSDAARVVGGEGWRELMPDARERARALARDGVVEVVQKGEVLDPDETWAGPVRIRMTAGGPEPA